MTQKAIHGMELLQKCQVPSWGLVLGGGSLQLCHRMPAPAILAQHEAELQKLLQIPTT